MAISTSEAHYIIESCLTDMRLDGRTKLEHRPYTITNKSTHAKTSQSSNAPAFILSNGSSRIHLPGSTTDVVCSVKADLVHPSPSKPKEGILELNVDLSLCGGGGTLEAPSGGGAQKRRRQQREEESQITSLLQRLILPHAVDHEGLVVWPGKYVWRLAIDVMVLRCDGCVLDASSIAIREALQNTKLPKVQAVMEGGNDAANSNGKNDLLVDGDHHKAVSPSGAQDCPLVITVSVLSSPPSATDAVTSTTGSKRSKSIAIIDARTEEEACASSRVCVAVDTKGMVCGVHTLGGGGAGMEEEGDLSSGSGASSMPVSMLGEVVTTASMSAKKLYSKLDEDRQLGNVKEVSSSRDDDYGYGNLLKNHFLIQ